MPGYLQYISGYQPVFSRGTLNTMKDMVESLVEFGDDMTGRIRQKEAYLRCSYAWARLNMEPVQPTHFVRSVELIHPEMEGLAEVLEQKER